VPVTALFISGSEVRALHGSPLLVLEGSIVLLCFSKFVDQLTGEMMAALFDLFLKEKQFLNDVIRRPSVHTTSLNPYQRALSKSAVARFMKGLDRYRQFKNSLPW